MLSDGMRGVRESLPAVCYNLRAILGRVYNLRVFGASNAEVNGVAGVPPWLPNVLVISIQMRPQMKHVKRSRLKGGSHVVHYNYSRGATIRRHMSRRDPASSTSLFPTTIFIRLYLIKVSN